MQEPDDQPEWNADHSLADHRSSQSPYDLLNPAPDFDSRLQPLPAFARPSSDTAEVPTLFHAALFFLLAILIVSVGELVTFAIGRQLPLFRHEDFATLAADPRLVIPAQAVPYLLLLAVTTAFFGALWHRPFWKAIRWNLPTGSSSWIGLIALGAMLGLLSTVGGNYLPMPKEAPILNDLMHSSTGAWFMFVFGTTGAPVVEELAFRGFLLPSLINFFCGFSTRSAARKRLLNPDMLLPHSPRLRPPSLLIVAVSILLTSVPFALLHSFQVSHAWAPILLIGIVSIALCLVRLRTNSLAASTLVHATYNFCLFTGMLIASDGFRHLEKLNN